MNAIPNWKIAFCAAALVNAMRVILLDTIFAVNVMVTPPAPDALGAFAPIVRAMVMPINFPSVFAAMVKVNSLAVMV